MTGEESKAGEVFQETVREAARLVAKGEHPPDRQWFFREARGRCLAANKKSVQAELLKHDLAEISPHAREQIKQLEPAQLAIWISSAPEPQRSAMALYYLDEFGYREILSILHLKIGELARALGLGRREFQAWLDSTIPVATE